MLDKIFGGIKTEIDTAHDSDPVSINGRDVTSELERYNRIFRGSHGYAFIDWDMESGKVHWRGGLPEQMGYDTAGFSKATDAKAFLRFVHLDDHEHLAESIRSIVKEGDRPGTIICRALKSDGGSVWVELRLEAVRREDGWVRHLSGLVSDISALKAAEEALKVSEARHARIIQASSDGIWEWAAERGTKKVQRTDDGGLDWSGQAKAFTFNDRCWEMLGFGVDEDIVRQGLTGWRRLMHPDDGALFDKVLVAHISKNEPFDVEYRIKGKDGEWRWIRGRGQMSYDSEGRLQAFSGSNMDITELKRAEERVLKAKVEAEGANKAKSEFLSSMSHELRTPLNAILGFTQLFELDTNLSQEQRDSIREIKSAGNHLLELVGDVLDLAQIEAGHLKLSLERVLPSRIINECVVLLKSQYEKRDLMLEIELNDLETQTVHADAIRLKQVLLNLLGNAAKYNKSAGHVKIECGLLGDDRMKINVTDTGPGIPANLQSQLFQPFNRLGAERSGVEGTGVGLVITKQLVEQMDGKIGFQSREHVGSQFWVELPLSGKGKPTPFLAENARGMDGEESKIPDLAISGSRNVLYVEDNPSNQRLMEQVLGRFPQLNLTVVGLAVQGLFLARSKKPDLIILDVNLPGVSGFELVEILKKDPLTESIPVIALSANVLPHDIQKGEESGFDEYLTKPLDLGELITVCNTYLA